MRFLSIVLALLFCLSCVSASSEKDVLSTPMKSYTVSDFSFSVPVDFEETSVTESEILFTAPSGAQIHIAILDGTGMDLEDAGEMFKYVIPVQTVQTQISTVNDLPYMRCDFSDDSMGVHGMAAMFLDGTAGDVYILFYISNNEISIMEHISWLKILDSIKAPSIYQQVLAQTTPEPTSTPSPDFDFDAVNRNPDKYRGEYFTIKGHVLQIIESPYEDDPDLTYVEARIATKDNYDNVIYVAYYRKPNEDRILEGDTLTFEAVGYGLCTYTSTQKISITLPLFALTEIISIE